MGALGLTGSSSHTARAPVLRRPEQASVSVGRMTALGKAV